jgi:NAD(P)H-flavin reductase
MKKLVLLFSHTLTADQNQDIEEGLQVHTVYKLSEELQKVWSQVPTLQDLDFSDYLKEVKTFLLEHLSKGDYVLIQGDFGATYHMVNFAKEHGFVAISSVNRRMAKEHIEDGIVKKYSEFKHECFREYQ